MKTDRLSEKLLAIAGSSSQVSIEKAKKEKFIKIF
jgi:hypothetical protein